MCVWEFVISASCFSFCTIMIERDIPRMRTEAIVACLICWLYQFPIRGFKCIGTLFTYANRIPVRHMHDSISLLFPFLVLPMSDDVSVHFTPISSLCRQPSLPIVTVQPQPFQLPRPPHFRAASRPFTRGMQPRTWLSLTIITHKPLVSQFPQRFYFSTLPMLSPPTAANELPISAAVGLQTLIFICHAPKLHICHKGNPN